MDNKIMIREAVTEKETAFFWERLYEHFTRDVFPDPDDEDREYFLGEEYRCEIERLNKRDTDRCQYIVFSRDGKDIGIALAVIYGSEDGKCFVMEFSVFPEFRGGGTGGACAMAFLDWAKEHGASYAELNYGGDERRRRFWQRVGFVENGADEWGEPLMLLPPKEELPFTVEILTDAKDWQLYKLENGFLAEIGEEAMSEEKQERLEKAISEGAITFFLAKRGCRAVGMCSIARCFSTFSCADTGVFDDFFIEPVFRGKGIARKLANAAQKWCEENGMASVTVCCAPCDEEMYRSLGFTTQLGTTFAHIK